jgi:broad specificity phosphatase PhoE
MTIYLVPLPPTKLTRRGRVNGYSYVKVDREGEHQLKTLAKRLRDRGIAQVVAADIHERPANLLAKEIGAPKRVTQKLRGFNFGRFAGRHTDEVDRVLLDLFKLWSRDQIVPIAGGDSWVSYERRFISAIRRLVDSTGHDVVLLLEPREIAVVRNIVRPGDPDQPDWLSIASFGHADIKPGKIYRVVKQEVAQNAAAGI